MRGQARFVSVLLPLLLAACNARKSDAAADARPEADDGPAQAPASEPIEQPPGCVAIGEAVARLDELQGADSFDPIALQDQLRGSTLEAMAELGRALAREQDVDWFTQQLVVLPERDEAGRRADLVAMATRLRTLAFLELRRRLAEVIDRKLHGDAAREAWRHANCLWTTSLRSLAQRADTLPSSGSEAIGEGWEPQITAALGDFALGIEQGDAGETTVAAAKQRAEKSLYVVFHRLILADVEAHDAAAAREALGLLDALDDRLADRNAAGLARMRAALAGDPASLEPALFELELAKAFAKRARKYCDKAVIGAEYATASAVAETWEGVLYSRLILPDMRKRLTDAGFDADAHVEDWQRYLEAIEAGEAEQAAEISPRLVEWNCAYQELLGIPECTASTNEPVE